MADLEQLNDWELLLSSDSEAVLTDSSLLPVNPDSDSSSESFAESNTAEPALGSPEFGDFEGEQELESDEVAEEEIRGFDHEVKSDVGFEGISETQEIGEENLLDSGLGVEVEIEDGGAMERVESRAGENQGVGEVEEEEEEEEKRGMVWWKVPFEILKFCVFRVNPVWSLSVAAAVLGFVILRKRLKPKTRNIPIKLAVEDKKASQLRMHAARLNEAFSVVRSVPIVRARLLTAGVTPWPTLNLR